MKLFMFVCVCIAAVTFLSPLFALAAGEPQATRPIMVAYCQRTAQPPTIDGKLDDPCWRNCEPLTDYVLDRVDRLAAQQTMARICYDDRFIYMAFDCRENDMAHTKAAATGWSLPWFEDSVEVFIDTTYAQQRYEQFGANLLGACNIKSPAPAMTMARGSREADGYTIELCIPLASLGLEGSIEGKTVGLNLTRNRYRTGADEHSSWGRLKDNFHKPMDFGQLIFGPRPVLQVQSALMHWKTAGLNVLELSVNNSSSEPAPLQLSVGDATFTAPASPGRSDVRGLLKLQLGQNHAAVTLRTGDRIVYKQNLPVVAMPPAASSAEVADLGCFRILTDKPVYLQGDEVVAHADAVMVGPQAQTAQITLTASFPGAATQTTSGTQEMRFRMPQASDGKLAFRLQVADAKGGQLVDISKEVPVRGLAKAQYEKQITAMEGRLNALTFSEGSKSAREVEYSRLKITRMRLLTAGMTDVDLRHLDAQIPELSYTLDMLEQGKAPVWGLRNKIYISEIDDSEQGYVVTVPPSYIADDAARFPVFIFLHGFINDAPWRPEGHLEAIRLACLSKGVIAVFPYGRGSTGYRYNGEKDVWDVLDQVRREYRVDEDRVYLGGFSMGGGGGMQLSAGRPHVLAASVLCSFSPRADQVPNLLNVPTWFFCGGQEAFVSALARAKDILQAQGDEAHFTSDPNSGHTTDFIDFDKLVGWLLEHRLVRSPKRICFATNQASRSQAYWATIDSFIDYGKSASMDIRAKGQHLDIQAQNVTALTLKPPTDLLDRAKPVEIVLNSQPQSTASIGTDGTLRVQCASPATRPSDAPAKSADALSGPMAEVFTQPLLIIYGSASDAQANKAEADSLAQGWNTRHHGSLSVKPDTAVTEEIVKSHGLIIVGAPAKDSLVARCIAKLPVTLSDDKIQIAGKEFRGTDIGVCVLGVNPLAPNRYVLLATGQGNQGVKLARQQVESRGQQDFVVVEKGTQDKPQVRASGWFAADWQTITAAQ